MRTILNYVIVRVSEETDNIIEVTGDQGHSLTLIRPTFKDDSDSLKYNRIYGEVVAVPDKLDGLEPYYRNYPGFPPPAAYRTADNLAKSLTRNGQRPLKDEEKVQVHNFYRCTAFSDTYTRPTDIEVEVGDKVYFHYLTIHRDNYMGKDKDGFKLFRVSYDKIICKVSEGEIIPVNGYVLIEKYWGDDYDEIEVLGRTMKVKMQGNIVTEINEKPVPLQGILRYRSHTPAIWDRFRGFVEVGDRVLYAGVAHLSKSGTEFENKIEGETFVTKREWDIVAYWDEVSGDFFPDGDYVKIKPKDSFENSILIIPDQYKIPPEMGTVVNGYGEIKDGCTVHYNRKSLFNLENDGYVYVRYGDITMITDQDVSLSGTTREKYKKFDGEFNF